MENIIYSLILGLVQGLTEFLPISSSGHLLVLHDFLNFDVADDLAFDVALHLGTLGALLIFFRRDVVKYIQAWFTSFAAKEKSVDQRVSWYLLIGTIPAVVVGLFLEDIIDQALRSVALVGLLLILGGILFFMVEKWCKKQSDFSALNWRKGLVIGVFQALALVPGVSRSGSTIVAGMIFGLTREQAARFSFLLGMPVIFGAGMKKMHDLVTGAGQVEWLLFVIGFLAALIAGYFTIKYFLRFLQRHSLAVFGWYRIVLGVLLWLTLI